MDTIFGHMVKTVINTSKIKFKRIHQIRKPPEITGDVPRDVIARFHKRQVKASCQLIGSYSVNWLKKKKANLSLKLEMLSSLNILSYNIRA